MSFIEGFTMILAQNKRLAGIVAAVGLLLVVIAIANPFVEGLNWSPFDFMVAAVLLLGTGVMGELVIRNVKEFSHRIILCIALLAGFCLVWAELAVGIFGTPFAGN